MVKFHPYSWPLQKLTIVYYQEFGITIVCFSQGSKISQFLWIDSHPPLKYTAWSKCKDRKEMKNFPP